MLKRCLNALAHVPPEGRAEATEGAEADFLPANGVVRGPGTSRLSLPGKGSFKVTSMRRFISRFLLLVAGALVVPACGGSDSDDGSSFADLLIDDFDAGLGNWTVVNPTVSVDPVGIGRGPAMLCQQTGAVPAEARTVLTFSTAGGLSVSVDIVAGSSTAEFQVVDNGAPAVRDTFVRILPNKLVFSIQGRTLTHLVAVDSHVHKFLFRISNGEGEWQRDGIGYFHSAFGASTVFVDLQDQLSGSKFDLVHVSTP